MTMLRSLLVALFVFALIATTLYAGNDPSAESAPASCHGTVRTESSATGCHGPTVTADCHGAKTEAKGASSCHGGRRSTVIQRSASRQVARQESRAERRAARASCHGEKKAATCECSDCDCCE